MKGNAQITATVFSLHNSKWNKFSISVSFANFVGTQCLLKVKKGGHQAAGNRVILFNYFYYITQQCHRASWGSAVRCKTRGHIEIITITAVLLD